MYKKNKKKPKKPKKTPEKQKKNHWAGFKKNRVFSNPGRIHMFVGLLDPDPDPLVRSTYPDPSIIKQKH